MTFGPHGTILEVYIMRDKATNSESLLGFFSAFSELSDPPPSPSPFLTIITPTAPLNHSPDLLNRPRSPEQPTKVLRL
jgi:hypothetical protein